MVRTRKQKDVGQRKFPCWKDPVFLQTFEAHLAQGTSRPVARARTIAELHYCPTCGLRAEPGRSFCAQHKGWNHRTATPDGLRDAFSLSRREGRKIGGKYFGHHKLPSTQKRTRSRLHAIRGFTELFSAEAEKSGALTVLSRLRIERQVLGKLGLCHCGSTRHAHYTECHLCITRQNKIRRREQNLRANTIVQDTGDADVALARDTLLAITREACEDCGGVGWQRQGSHTTFAGQAHHPCVRECRVCEGSGRALHAFRELMS